MSRRRSFRSVFSIKPPVFKFFLLCRRRLNTPHPWPVEKGTPCRGESLTRLAMPRPGGGVDRCGAVGGDPPHALRGGPLDQEDRRRTGRDRKTIRRAIRSPEPPGYQAPVGSKLDPHREQIAQLVRDVEGITNTRIRELITEAGYRGSKTILDDYLRELRPILCPKRTYQRTVYRPGELAQFDLIEPKAGDPGRPRPDPPGLCRDLRARLVSCRRGRPRLLKAL